MITVSEAAAEHIKKSAQQGKADGLPLRVAAKKNIDGSIHYGMGFEEKTSDNDLTFKSNGITVLIAPQSRDLLQGTEIDYVKLDNGEYSIIFKNPNDPGYTSGDGASI